MKSPADPSQKPRETQVGVASSDAVRYVSSQGPVNRRTARQRLAAAPAPQPHASLRQRLAQMQQRHRLGRPFRQRLAPQSGIQPARWSGVQVLVTVTFVLAGVSLLLAGLQASGGLAVLGLGLLVLGSGGWLWLRRQPTAGGGAMPLLPLFDAAALARLDAVLEHLAAETDAAPWAMLRRLADTLERMQTLMGRVGVNEYFTQEDHFYVTECVRRYLPDTLQAYLQVPRQHRDQPMAGVAGAEAGALSANDLLLSQLTALQTELERREQALNRASTEALQQQQRFLAARQTGRDAPL